jgi:hypothetical protein
LPPGLLQAQNPDVRFLTQRIIIKKGRMRKLLFYAIVALVFASCGNSKKNEQKDQTAQGKKVVQSFDLDSMLTVADRLVDDTIKVKGYVTHTCKHSGKRCFIVGESQSATLRVEATGDIAGFNRELTGSLLEITGVLKERRLTKEYLDQSEKELNEKKATEDGSTESCQAELNNISEMKAKMKELGKDYYSIYFLDGLNYEVVQ